MSDNEDPQIQFQVNLPDELELGVFADFASVWHTPNTFVIDFLAVKAPQHPAIDPATGQLHPEQPVLEARVASRVRIPSEQIFPLIQALQQQGEQWLVESGREEPPADWVTNR
ncbi:DUF3467 domain-containing protein [Galbitalea soli]|uniref:DUF3467 domain-containing protein n=1 Tax=Galbitalea soli TaxID=1268042 RepID=A0A7C9PPD0_9MICO|nr:DUF3467 domain-containing protein [Galbitalea soli]NEM92071.1 DUF3467 domain-containing protein [Galbitalea soli]NYJ31977.1 hypothetical protein [Galbitalea soli]